LPAPASGLSTADPELLPVLPPLPEPLLVPLLDPLPLPPLPPPLDDPELLPLELPLLDPLEEPLLLPLLEPELLPLLDPELLPLELPEPSVESTEPFGVPMPVGASHPGPAVHWTVPPQEPLLPLVMSWNPVGCV